MSVSIAETIEGLTSGRHLSRQAGLELFSRIGRGDLIEVEISAVLVALKAKGETPDEIAGAVEALRLSARPFDVGDLAVADTCGTGGDGARTVNISTASALLAAEAGVAVAKHGNRSISSSCGSADVLERCGVAIDVEPEQAYRSLEELGICFLFAPDYHPGMRHAMPVRRALGVRTIFNLLGPLANPAQPRWQLVGVYDPDLCLPLAQTLGLLGCEAALVVHGSGIDEIALHDRSVAVMWRDGGVEELIIEPDRLGLTRCALDELRGGNAEENARWLTTVLAGGGSRAHQESVALNTGALLWICGRAKDLLQGVEQALEVLRSGRTVERLNRWAEMSHGS